MKYLRDAKAESDARFEKFYAGVKKGYS